MNIKVLESQMNEVLQKDGEMQELRQKQVSILLEKTKEFAEVIELYRSKGLFFYHPDYEFKTTLGPILAVDEESGKIFIYHVKENRLITMLSGEFLEDSERAKWSDLIQAGYFEDALKGFNYLLEMPAAHLEFYNNEIAKLKEQIKDQE